MCGFLGKISNKPFDNNRLIEANSYLTCRGPDEFQNLYGSFSNIFENDDLTNFSFLFNRLSIIDLGPNSSQPMISKKYKTVVMFNGEIFNHERLRESMEKDGIQFFSDHSDTEVVLNGLSVYGIDYINKFIGQFSIVFYNSKNKQLSLIRDRLGQKPLFYSYEKNSLNFSSNLKSLVSKDSMPEVDSESLINYLNYNVVPSPKTIFKNYYKVEPGEYISFQISNEINKVEQKKYWKLEDYVSNNKFDSEKFFELFSDAVKLRQIADVPVANFLSGGIDSTTIVKNIADREEVVNTFSVGFNNPKYDESIYSREVAREYSTNHTEEKLDIENIEKLINDSIEAFDEPYCDPSTVPSFLISKIMSKKYKAAISGDGGDELLGGYIRTNQTIKPKNKLFSLFKYLNRIYPNHFGTGNRLLKNSSDIREAYGSYLSDEKFLNMLNLESTKEFEKNIFSDDYDLYKNLLLVEYKFFLSEMMMLKVDRTSMANSLEVRSPFVDHRLVEYVLSSNSSYIDYKNPKAILKKYLSSDFNSSFLDRKKMGFVFEIEDWVYTNKDLVMAQIFENNTNLNINSKKIDLLFKFKSRINAIRIWKLYFIEKYLSSFN